MVAGLAPAAGTSFREPEIQNLGLPAIGDENIRGLDVAMHDAFRVRRVECIRDSGAQVQKHFDIERPVIERVLERAPLQKFHGDEGAAAIFADIVNRANVGMIQSGSSLRFALKTLERLRIVFKFRREKFQRDGAVQFRVFGLVDDAHASAAKSFEHAEMQDRSAG